MREGHDPGRVVDDQPGRRLGALPGAGRSGKTLRAVERTLADVGEVFLGIAADRRKPPRVGTQIGGLRGGFAGWTATGIRLQRVQYVPGVTVTGFSQRGGTTRVTVSGAAGAHGTMRVLAGGQVIARLDGRRITGHVPAGTLARAAAAAAVASRGYVSHERRVALR
jgi:hypothetical protein